MPTVTFLNAAGSTEYKDVDSGAGTSGDPYIDRNRTITGDALTALQLLDDVVYTDDGSFSVVVDKVAAVGALHDDTAPDYLDEGDIGAIRQSIRRELYVQLRDAAGNERGLNIDTSGNITVNLSAADNAVLDAIQAAVETLDNAIAGTEMQVDVVTSALPTGASTSANQSTANASLGNIETDTGSIDTSLNNIEAGYAADATALGSGVLIQGDDGTDRKNINVDPTTGDVQVDVTNTVTVDGSGVTQPVSGTVTANLSATDNAVLDNIETNTDFGAVTGGGVEATALRVTLADDSTGVVSVDDNGGSLTVDNADITTLAGAVAGTEMQVDVVTSALPTGAATETTLDAVKTAVEVLDNAVAGTEMQVDVVAPLPAGTNAIGKLAANSGVDIGDVDVTSLPGALQGPGNPSVDSFSSAVVDLAASTANQSLVAAPGASKQIWVFGLFMMADTAAGTVTLQDEDDTALSGTMAVSDEGGWVLPMSGNFAMPWIKVATNKALEADTGACTVDGILTYAIVSV